MSVQFPGGQANDAFPGSETIGDFRLGGKAAGAGDTRLDSWPPPVAGAAVAGLAPAPAPPSPSSSPRFKVAGLYTAAALNLYGSQLFWLGAWEAIDVDPVYLGLTSQTRLRDWLYTLGGAAGLILITYTQLVNVCVR